MYISERIASAKIFETLFNILHLERNKLNINERAVRIYRSMNNFLNFNSLNLHSLFVRYLFVKCTVVTIMLLHVVNFYINIIRNYVITIENNKYVSFYECVKIIIMFCEFYRIN